MVVKSSSAPSSPAAAASSSAHSAHSDPLRRPQGCTGHVKKNKETELEFSRLKSLVPTISKKQSVSKLDVILEAIRYIDQLQDQLIDQINDNKISISASALLVDKENAATSGSASISGPFEEVKGRRERHRSSE